ncbi:MAG: phenylacetate--CoA ligase family protein [Deltaproteobacteria bacterium]|nr:phenylacetate--CoA ligase family protein [Deltaproteobacteria bacterium]
MSAVPADRLERNPLMTEAGYETWLRLVQHPRAPRWNYVVGDRVRAEDLPHVDALRAAVAARRPAAGAVPPPELCEWILRLRATVGSFHERVPEGFELQRDWAHVPTMSREDLVVRIDRVVPVGEDLSRLIVYDTSGTSGHALVVPHHPRDVAQAHALMEFALARHGATLRTGPDAVAAINLGAQEAHTVVFATTFAVWDQAGFAKVNLHPQEWRSLDDARGFFAELAPQLLTGDPVGFAEAAAWEIDVRPKALVSTALALSAAAAARLRGRFGCPVIDWYSTTETGPLAYSCPLAHGLHVLPPDVFVEALDADGFPAAAGERGELTVTGGRNPFVPLLRYRTGDWGRLDPSPCPCGDPAPRIVDLEGRRPVFFRDASGGVINAVDVGRVLRRFPVLQHEVVQRADGSCDVALRFLPGERAELGALDTELRGLLGPGTALTVRVDETLAERSRLGKVLAYRSELPSADDADPS